MLPLYCTRNQQASESTYHLTSRGGTMNLLRTCRDWDRRLKCQSKIFLSLFRSDCSAKGGDTRETSEARMHKKRNNPSFCLPEKNEAPNQTREPAPWRDKCLGLPICQLPTPPRLDPQYSNKNDTNYLSDPLMHTSDTYVRTVDRKATYLTRCVCLAAIRGRKLLSCRSSGCCRTL